MRENHENQEQEQKDMKGKKEKRIKFNVKEKIKNNIRRI